MTGTRRGSGARPGPRCGAALLLGLFLVLAPGCGSGPPRHTARPGGHPARPARETVPPGARERDTRAFRDGVVVRIGLHWRPGSLEISSGKGLTVDAGEGSSIVVPGAQRLVVSAGGNGSGSVRVAYPDGRILVEGRAPVRITGRRDGDLVAGPRAVRGWLELSARADTLFLVNALPLEDYLRGVVPREIGPRPPRERAAVAAQAVAARTYTMKRLGQYGSLPFDLYADVQDQVYVGVDGEGAVADEAIRETRGLVLADGKGLIEAYYSSTCGGKRSDIRAVWPHREAYASLRGGPDGRPGREWCRSSGHFTWEETWDGKRLSELVREHLPGQLELPPGSVRGELIDLRIRRRGPSGRAAEIEYVTTAGKWTVPGDRNRWILRRPDGSILRSVLIDLDVGRTGGRVVRVVATGRGNGHGVGMCQTGAIGRARAGQDFREILDAYYPGARIRRVRGSDLPEGRAAAS